MQGRLRQVEQDGHEREGGLQSIRLSACAASGKYMPKNNECDLRRFYAHIEVLVTFLLIIFFGFLVIARYHTMRF